MKNDRSWFYLLWPISLYWMWLTECDVASINMKNYVIRQHITNTWEHWINLWGSSIKYVRKIFRTTNISNHLLRTRTCEYQGVRNVSFSEILRTYLMDDSLIFSKNLLYCNVNLRLPKTFIAGFSCFEVNYMACSSIDALLLRRVLSFYVQILLI